MGRSVNSDIIGNDFNYSLSVLYTVEGYPVNDVTRVSLFKYMLERKERKLLYLYYI